MERLQNPSEKGLGEDGKKTNFLCIAVKQTNQILFPPFFYSQSSPIANSSRLPISAMGDIRHASAPRGELLCAAVFN